MLAVLVLAFIMIVGLQAPGLVRQKMWRELAAFSILLFLGLILSCALVLEIRLPSPTQAVEKLLHPVTAKIEQLLK